MFASHKDICIYFILYPAVPESNKLTYYIKILYAGFKSLNK